MIGKKIILMAVGGKCRIVIFVLFLSVIFSHGGSAAHTRH